MTLTTSQFRHLGLAVAPVCYLGRAADIFYYMGLATGFYHLGLAVSRQPFLLPGSCSSPPPRPFMLLGPCYRSFLLAFLLAFSTIWPLLPPFLQPGHVTGFFYYMSLASSSLSYMGFTSGFLLYMSFGINRILERALFSPAKSICGCLP